MSKITEIIPLNTPIELSVYWQILGTDCKHYFQLNEPGDGPYFKLGDEVACPTCAEVKAARGDAHLGMVKAMEAAKIPRVKQILVVNKLLEVSQ